MTPVWSNKTARSPAACEGWGGGGDLTRRAFCLGHSNEMHAPVRDDRWLPALPGCYHAPGPVVTGLLAHLTFRGPTLLAGSRTRPRRGAPHPVPAAR